MLFSLNVQFVQVWRIENFEEVPVEDERQFGKFYTGDSYIVLKKNMDKMGNTSYNIHMWIGKYLIFFL